jgi:lipopolysaccharide export system permease protein
MKASWSIFKLIAGAVLPAVLMVWFVFCGLELLNIMLDQARDLGRGNYNFFTLLAYLLLTLPRRAYQLFPYAAVVGTLIGLGRLAAQSELTALRAIGVSKLRIALYAIGGLSCVLLLVVSLSEWWGAEGDKRADALVANAKRSGLSVASGSGLWLREGETFVNIRQVVDNSQGALQLWQLRLLRFDADNNLQRLTTAASAQQTPDGWLMKEVEHREFANTSVTVSKFATELWRTKLSADQVRARALKPREQSIMELRENIRYARGNSLDDIAFQSALWYRLSFPLTTLALVLLAVPFAFGNLRSGGLGKRILLGMVVAISFYFAQRTFVNLFETYRFNMALAYLLPVILIASLGAFNLRRA